MTQQNYAASPVQPVEAQQSHCAKTPKSGGELRNLGAQAPALLLGAAAFAVLFQAAIRDWPLVMLAAISGYLSTRLGTGLYGPSFGVFIGGLVVGALSNLYARYRRRPGALVREPGIILLVPGSVGFSSISALLDRNVHIGMNAALLLISLLISLVAGLLFGDLLIGPRRSL